MLAVIVHRKFQEFWTSNWQGNKWNDAIYNILSFNVTGTFQLGEISERQSNSLMIYLKQANCSAARDPCLELETRCNKSTHSTKKKNASPIENI